MSLGGTWAHCQLRGPLGLLHRAQQSRNEKGWGLTGMREFRPLQPHLSQHRLLVVVVII